MWRHRVCFGAFCWEVDGKVTYKDFQIYLTKAIGLQTAAARCPNLLPLPWRSTVSMPKLWAMLSYRNPLSSSRPISRPEELEPSRERRGGELACCVQRGILSLCSVESIFSAVPWNHAVPPATHGEGSPVSSFTRHPFNTMYGSGGWPFPSFN